MYVNARAHLHSWVLIHSYCVYIIYINEKGFGRVKTILLSNDQNHNGHNVKVKCLDLSVLLERRVLTCFTILLNPFHPSWYPHISVKKSDTVNFLSY